jgi:hypothetical protein
MSLVMRMIYTRPGLQPLTLWTASTLFRAAESEHLLTGPNGRSCYLSSTFWGSALSQQVRVVEC